MALYNPYLNNPYMQYQQPYYQPIQQQQQIQQPSTNVIWIENEQAARNYPVAPGNTVMLMDNDNPVAYKKSADLSGRALPLEIYDLVKREPKDAPKEENHQIDLTEYLTRREFDSYASEVNKRLSEINTYDDDEEDEEEEELKPVRRRKGKR